MQESTTIKWKIDGTSEINALIFWIILNWSGGMFAGETSRVEYPSTGKVEELGASNISWFEVSGIASFSVRTQLVKVCPKTLGKRDKIKLMITRI